SEPSPAWMAGEIDDATLVSQVQSTFSGLIESWRESRA
ncbi:IolC protein, partial [Pseudomonas syringae pv. spinaceae]